MGCEVNEGQAFTCKLPFSHVYGCSYCLVKEALFFFSFTGYSGKYQ